MKRTDIHRPSAINPGEYEYVAMEYIKIGAEGDIVGDCQYLQECRAKIRAHMARTGGAYSGHEHGGNCHVCGASAIYTVLFYHAPSNTYVRTGQECADKMGYGDADFNAFRTAIKDALELKAGKRKAQAVLEATGLGTCWALYQAGNTFQFSDAHFAQHTPANSDFSPCWAWLHADGTPLTELELDELAAARRDYDRTHKEEQTIQDIVTKLVKYGSISPAQEGFLGKLLVRIADRPQREAARKAEQEAAANCPTGRVVVEGVILTVRDQESSFGTVTKILVKHDTGYKVWGTRPSGDGIGWAKIGDRVSFKATITPSDKDPKFGFYSRPTKGQMIMAAQVAA